MKGIHLIGIGGGLLVVAAVACVILRIRVRRYSPLGIEMLGVATRPTGNERGDWLVRVDTRLTNRVSRETQINTVAFEALSPDGGRMGAQKLCGDRTKALQSRAHPPELTMRLPISLGARRRERYTFELFFPYSLRRFWPGAKLQMTAGLASREHSSAVSELPAEQT